MIGDNWDSFPETNFVDCTLISSCIKNLMPSFILHNKISFFGSDKLVLLSVQTQGPHKYETLSNYSNSRPYISVVAQLNRFVDCIPPKNLIASIINRPR